VSGVASTFIGCIKLAPIAENKLRMIFHIALTASVEPLGLINDQDCASGWSSLCSTLVDTYSLTLTSATAFTQQLTCATSENVVAVPDVASLDGIANMDNVIRLTSWAIMEKGGSGAADITDAPDFNGDSKALQMSTSAVSGSYPSVSFNGLCILCMSQSITFARHTGLGTS
jgi:hypothetical protein